MHKIKWNYQKNIVSEVKDYCRDQVQFRLSCKGNEDSPSNEGISSNKRPEEILPNCYLKMYNLIEEKKDI